MQEIDNSQQLNPDVALEPSQVDLLAGVLSDAFQYQPSFVYMFPDERTRPTLSGWLFRCAIRASQAYGQLYVTENIDGGALWVSPAYDLTFDQMVRTEMEPMPIELDWPTFKRCVRLGASVQKVRKQLAALSHWYLMAVGVKWSKDRDRLASDLMEPVLSRADGDGMSCYLETYDENQLPFYERHGFRIAGAGFIPGGGPSFWAMTRRACRS